MIHNNCKFEIVRYYANKAVIQITVLNGTTTNGENPQYLVKDVEDLTTNLGGGFEAWVKDTY